MKRFVFSMACLLIAGAQATAQPVAGVVEGAGVRVGEGTVIHPVLGVESGVVHNVFYEDGDPETSAILRVIFQLAAGSLPDERMQAPEGQPTETRNYGDLAFRLELQTQYEEYLSGDDRITSQRNVQLGALARALVFPRRTWQFAASEEFQRIARPLNFESSDQIVRDMNRIGLDLIFKPQGRSVSGSIGYANAIDYFEDDDQQFANRVQHTARLRANWQVLPVTRLYGELSYGFFRPLGDESTRVPSNPLRAHVGIATALTVKTSLNARLGFGWSDYDTGPDYLNATGSVQLGYRFSPQLRFGAMYEYDFADSINANFYRDHAIKARLDWQRDRFALNTAAELRFRLYRGVVQEIQMPSTPDRSDVIFAIAAGASYNFRDWIALTFDYQFITDQTEFRYVANPMDPGTDDPSYTRHTALAGVRAAY